VPQIRPLAGTVHFVMQLAMQSAVLAIVNPYVRLSIRLSVRLSVCHTLALCQNDSSYDHAVFTVG